jgi:integrase
MAGQLRYFLNRNGRYYARLVVPKDLRPYLEGKTELRIPLGADRRLAIRKHPGALAALQERIAEAERKRANASGQPVAQGRYPLSPSDLAATNYRERLIFDEELRHDPRYAAVSIDDLLASNLREAMAGRLTDEQLRGLVGDRIERFRRRGNISADFGTPEWRTLATALCVSEYEALARAAERDEGDFSGRPSHPLLEGFDAEAPPREPPLSLKGLFSDYVEAKRQIGQGKDIGRRWKKPIDDLVKFIGHDDARRLTKKDVTNWRDSLVGKLSPKTIAHTHLAGLKAILNWAVEQDLLTENVAKHVKLPVPRKVRSRERGFTDDEALAILQLAYDYQATDTGNPVTTERPTTTAAKRWAPWLCAFTGARIGEITQVRKQDFRKVSGHYVMRITPEAGSVKTGQYRDVPLHPQLIELGFWDYVQTGPDPLFYVPADDKDPKKLADETANRVRRWLAEQNAVPTGVQPNHGWRHRFKTVFRELEISDRVADAITGHAGRVAGDEYGDVTIATKAAAIRKLPHYPIGSDAPPHRSGH